MRIVGPLAAGMRIVGPLAAGMRIAGRRVAGRKQQGRGCGRKLPAAVIVAVAEDVTVAVAAAVDMGPSALVSECALLSRRCEVKAVDGMGVGEPKCVAS